jgi:aspartyl protease family protein
MFQQTAKLAFSFGLMALLFVAAVQNHWFARGFDAFVGPAPPPGRAIAAPAPSGGSAPPLAVASGDRFGEVDLEPNSVGQYETDVEIDGTPIHALVDTGATYVALTAKDARQLDIDPPSEAFNIPTQTANGTAMVAHVRLRQLRVGDITVYDVDALVARPGALHMSLLGMSFLKKLERFEVADGRFVMKQ